MIGGALPGRTEVVSIRIYQLVESLRFGEAATLAGGLAAFSFVALFGLLLLERWAQGRRS
jgi:molybdate transport system permease protein